MAWMSKKTSLAELNPVHLITRMQYTGVGPKRIGQVIVTDCQIMKIHKTESYRIFALIGSCAYKPNNIFRQFFYFAKVPSSLFMISVFLSIVTWLHHLQLHAYCYF